MENSYSEARKIFQTLGLEDSIELVGKEGARIRAALHTIIARNPKVKKIFKTKTQKGKINVWRVK